MADLLLDVQSAPATPAAGQAALFVDTTSKRLVQVDDTGMRCGAPLSRKWSTASQAGFAADTYVTNSGILIPSFGMQAGQKYRWVITGAKTAAGVAAAVYTVRIGSLQTTGDTARLTLTANVAQTAAVSGGVLTVEVLVRSVGASGVIAGGVGWAASVGFGGGISALAAGFDNSALAGLFIGLSINGGASAAWTLDSVEALLVG